MHGAVPSIVRRIIISPLLCLSLLCLPLLTLTSARADSDSPFNPVFSVAVQWNELALAGIRAGSAKPTITTHELFLLSASMYDAYAMYDAVAAPYALKEKFRRDSADHTEENQIEAISQAAYQALIRLYPQFEQDQGYFSAYLNQLGFNELPSASGKDPSSIGFHAAKAVFKSRRNDLSNRKRGYKELISPIFSEPYVSRNEPDDLSQGGEVSESFDPNFWQPLRVPTGILLDGDTPIIDDLNLDSYGDQQFLTPHWGAVTPFAITHGAMFLPAAPPKYGDDTLYTDAKNRTSTNHRAYLRQFNKVLKVSAKLNDRQKTIAEFWADGPRTESPPGHWNQLARGLVIRDSLSVGDTVKMYFALNGALLDAGIATWNTKRHYDYVRPATAIRWLHRNVEITAWAGPNNGTGQILGQNWSPYQRLTFVTPPFPEYVSGHSTFSRAAAEVLKSFSGGNDTFYDGITRIGEDIDGNGREDYFGQFVQAAGSLAVEDAPARNIRLRWTSFTEAADEAGQSRIYGGIHIQDGDLRGRDLGAKIGKVAWQRARDYFQGQPTE